MTGGLFDYYQQLGRKNNVDLELIRLLIQTLKKHAGEEDLELELLPEKYRRAFQDQYEIGWQNWYKSRVAKSLRDLFPKPGKTGSVLLQLLNHTTSQWKVLWQERN